MKNTVFLLFLLVFKGVSFAQQSCQNKCSPAVVLRDTAATAENFALVVADLPVFREWATGQHLEIVRVYPPANIIVLRISQRDLAAKILHRPDVLFADRTDENPREELPVPGHNLFVNKINVAHSGFPSLDGSSITVSVKEYRFDTADVDLKNRAIDSADPSQPITSHAGIMATLIGGAGNSDAAGRGVAQGARLISTAFNNLLPENDYASVGVSVQNHSYGLGIENYYGAGALAYDKSVEANPSLLHVFSAGNKGVDTSGTGAYASVPGFANLTGNFKMAKNVLTVGAVDSFSQTATFSSHGPAYDGRVKPDLVAFGQDGSSGAAALVSGAAAVLQQAYLEKTGSLPMASLVRAVLLNDADDIGPAGPDFFSGFGSLNLKKAIDAIDNQKFIVGSVVTGETLSIPIDLPANVAQLKITLAWDDPPAMPNASKALINDLDLSVADPGGSDWFPWVLNFLPHPDSLRLPARRGRDTLNNAEQVALLAPQPGTYVIRVTGAKVQSGSQRFSLVWEWETTAQFGWDFPVKRDPVVAGRDALLRWESTFADTAGILEYRIAGSAGWQPAAPAVDLRTGWYRWLAPDTFAEAQVRMRVGGLAFESDTFLIARALQMHIGFNCPDSVLLFWNAAAAGGAYLLSGLGERYLEPLLILTDTFAVLRTVDFPQKRFSVTAVGQHGAGGLRSPAPDIGEQGVACYFESFLAELNEELGAKLRLGIGTRYGVQSVGIEKMKTGGFGSLKTWQPVDSEEFTFTDSFLQQGANRYRARLDLNNGAILYSDTATVYFPGENELLVFPNPTSQNSFSVLTNIADEASFVLYDMQGRLILEVLLDEMPKAIALPAGLPKGCYPFFLRANGHLKPGGTLLIGF